MLSEKDFLNKINKYLDKVGMSKTAFGVKVMNDPNFIFEIENEERSPQLKTIKKVNDFINQKQGLETKVL